MKTIPISGTIQSVTFFEDDTIETVRQWIALTVGSHPDRLFITAKGKFPREYYFSNPKRWSDLFFRLSYDGKMIRAATLKTYITQIRPISMTERDVTLEEWEARDEYLTPIYHPEVDFEEVRILGVNESKSMVVPLPPTDVPLPAAVIPIPSLQSLFETFHPYEVTAFSATEVTDTVSEVAQRIYFPLLRQDTPPTIETLRAPLQNAQKSLQSLLDLATPTHETTAIVRAKWFLPLISTRFAAPRARFEQMFYGLTVSKKTPYVGYFTAKNETMRHKFYVEDAKQKKPFLDTSMLRGWLNASLPQRRKPTLLVYRGTARGAFDRIAITPDDVTLSVFRGKDSKESLGDLRESLKSWLHTLDAVLPFLAPTDLEDDRWELGDMSIVAEYAKEVREFDMHRFPCLQNLFSYQNDSFRLLRAEYSTGDISPREMQAYQILNQEDSEDSADYLAREMDLTPADAEELFQTVKAKAEDINVEKAFKSYPIVKFTNKEVILKFVTQLDRTLQYVDILRHVLSSDDEAVNAVCPRRMERVAAVVAVPQQDVNVEGEFEEDADFFAAMGAETEPAPVAETVEAPAPRTRKLAVGKATTRTYNYFNNLLQKFDPETFDKDVYPWECKKPRQVVALTPEQKSKLGPEYNYDSAPASEKIEVEDPTGTILCPAYWCIRDEAPLRPDQLVAKDDGELHCPICDGKVRTSDNLDVAEYTVIDRTKAGLYPNYLKTLSKRNGRRIPCCFQVPRSTSEVLGAKTADNEGYVLSTYPLPGLRIGWLEPESLRKQLAIETHYSETTKIGRLITGEYDFFVVGLQRPSKVLPVLLNTKKSVPPPKDGESYIKRCSFFRTWTHMGEGVTSTERIINGIQEAFEHGELSLIQELEYAAAVLNCEVIRVDPKTSEVLCGFWSDAMVAKGQTTLVMIGDDLLCSVARIKKGKQFKMDFAVDIRKSPFPSETATILQDLHTRACSVNLPTFADAIRELQLKGKSEYTAVLDPVDRTQALLVTGEVLLPIVPNANPPDRGVPTKPGYADISKEDLPTGAAARAFLRETRHPGFRPVREHQNVAGDIVELELASGFRVPIQPETGTPKPATEILDTIRKHDEKDLLEEGPHKEDLEFARETIYESEIYEFLLFSLAKDLQTTEYADLRAAIARRDKTLLRGLQAWYKEEAYSDRTKSPAEFVNKVRTPCGQYTKADACKASSLCGWHKDTCKIKVKPHADAPKILRRMAKTLHDNNKIRALVLDDRVSPFFSTILYMEMPHELIVTSI